jgi:hypothetical protein
MRHRSAICFSGLRPNPRDRDTKGDVYEYMLSKIATAGQNGLTLVGANPHVRSMRTLVATFYL